MEINVTVGVVEESGTGFIELILFCYYLLYANYDSDITIFDIDIHNWIFGVSILYTIIYGL